MRRWSAIAGALCALLSAFTAAPAGAAGRDAEYDYAEIYETREIDEGSAVDLTITCPVGWTAHDGWIERAENREVVFVELSFTRESNIRQRVLRLRAIRGARTPTVRVTVKVTCRRYRPPRGFAVAAPVRTWLPDRFVELDPGERPQTVTIPCPPASPGRRSVPVGLGHRYVDLEPGRPPEHRAAAAGNADRRPARMVAMAPSRTGYRVTVAPGDERGRMQVQAICLPPRIALRDRDGDRVTEDVVLFRTSFAAFVRPGVTSLSAACPRGFTPAAAGYELPVSEPGRLVASPTNRPAAAGWSFLVPAGTGFRARLHLGCLPGRLVFARGRGQVQVDTTIGPITIRQG